MSKSNSNNQPRFRRALTLGSSHPSRPETIATSLVVALLAISSPGHAGSVAGLLKDQDGQRVRKAEICVYDSAGDLAGGQCTKVGRSTGRGKFLLANLKKGTYYLSVRRPEDRPDASWLPELRKFVLSRTGSVVKAADFTLVTQANADGFRNFRNDVTLTGVDFPELARLTAGGLAVGLKVYVPAANAGEEPTILFIGRVANPAELSVPVSIPRGVTALAYQIFRSGEVVDGQLQLPVEP